MNRFLVLVTLASLITTGCQRDEQAGAGDISQAEADQAWRKQADDYDRQTARMDKIIERQELELEKAMAHSERYEKLLTKAEEQSRRVNAILEAFEKKLDGTP